MNGCGPGVDSRAAGFPALAVSANRHGPGKPDRPTTSAENVAT